MAEEKREDMAASAHGSTRIVSMSDGLAKEQRDSGGTGDSLEVTPKSALSIGLIAFQETPPELGSVRFRCRLTAWGPACMPFRSAQEMADLGLMDATLGQRVGFNGCVRALWEVMGQLK